MMHLIALLCFCPVKQTITNMIKNAMLDTLNVKREGFSEKKAETGEGRTVSHHFVRA